MLSVCCVVTGQQQALHITATFRAGFVYWASYWAVLRVQLCLILTVLTSYITFWLSGRLFIRNIPTCWLLFTFWHPTLICDMNCILLYIIVPQGRCECLCASHFTLCLFRFVFRSFFFFSPDRQKLGLFFWGANLLFLACRLCSSNVIWGSISDTLSHITRCLKLLTV